MSDDKQKALAMVQALAQQAHDDGKADLERALVQVVMDALRADQSRQWAARASS